MYVPTLVRLLKPSNRATSFTSIESSLLGVEGFRDVTGGSLPDASRPARTGGACALLHRVLDRVPEHREEGADQQRARLVQRARVDHDGHGHGHEHDEG